MSKKKRIAVFFGGMSGEHEVSLVSAASVIEVLRSRGHEIVPVGITKSGKWITSETILSDLRRNPGITSETTLLLSSDPGFKGLVEISEKDGRTSFLRRIEVDAIFPVLHGTYGEDGTMQGLFEMSGLPYVGCGVASSAFAMDKIISKRIFAAAGLRVVPDVFFDRREWKEDRGAVIARCEGLGYNLFVKPANTGSSVGITKAHDRKELEAGIEAALEYDFRGLAEASVDGAREIETAVLGNDRPEASIPGEITPSNEFYDYAAKYEDGKTETTVPARLSEDETAEIRKMAVTAYSALGCTGLARVDFLKDPKTGETYINEINTLPGFTSISMYPKLWEATGVPYGELLERLLDLAEKRLEEKNRNSTSYSTKNEWFREKEDKKC